MRLIWGGLGGARRNPLVRERIQHYRRKHRVLLLKNALPVFVAASISRAILSVILKLSDGLSSILAAFIYTFVISHSVGFLLVAFLPDNLHMKHYYHSLVTETVGFAWKESALLLVVDQIARRGSIGVGIGTWVGFTVFAGSFVCMSTLACARLSFPSSSKRSISTFTSEVFALSIAYTATVVIAYGVYWQQRDDSSVYAAADDAEGEGDTDTSAYTPLSHAIFFCYAVLLTYGIAIIQSYNEEKYTAADPATTGGALSGGPRQSGGAAGEAGECAPSCGDRQSSAALSDEAIESDLESRNAGYTTSGAVLARWVTWDEYFHIHSALYHLLQTTQGYLVGSAWFLWASFTFEVMFSFSGFLTVLAYTIFAVWMTYVMARFMSLSSIKLEALWDTCNISSRAFVRRRKRQQLKMAACRITVGWIWESVVAEAFIQIAGIGSHEMTDSVKLAVKCGAAVLIFVLGLIVQNYLFEHVHDDAEEEHSPLREPIIRTSGE